MRVGTASRICSFTISSTSIASPSNTATDISSSVSSATSAGFVLRSGDVLQLEIGANRHFDLLQTTIAFNLGASLDVSVDKDLFAGDSLTLPRYGSPARVNRYPLVDWVQIVRLVNMSEIALPPSRFSSSIRMTTLHSSQ